MADKKEEIAIPLRFLLSGYFHEKIKPPQPEAEVLSEERVV